MRDEGCEGVASDWDSCEDVDEYLSREFLCSHHLRVVRYEIQPMLKPTPCARSNRIQTLLCVVWLSCNVVDVANCNAVL